MYTVIKGNSRQKLYQKAQVDAFVKDGWNIAESAEKPSPCDDRNCEDALREQAAELGLKPHHAASSATIRKMIDERKAELENEDGRQLESAENTPTDRKRRA